MAQEIGTAKRAVDFRVKLTDNDQTIFIGICEEPFLAGSEEAEVSISLTEDGRYEVNLLGEYDSSVETEYTPSYEKAVGIAQRMQGVKFGGKALSYIFPLLTKMQGGAR